MLAATGIAIFIIPLLFVLIERRAGKGRAHTPQGGPTPGGPPTAGTAPDGESA